jgi:phospholipase/carboxylesterase
VTGQHPQLNQDSHRWIPGSDQCIITLHGFGGNESEVSQLGQWLDPSASVFSPRGGKSLKGANYWYGTLTESGFDPNDIEARCHLLWEVISNAANHYSFDPKNAIFAGFSNGAAMVIALAVFYPSFVSRVAAFSGVFPFATLPDIDLSGTRVWFSHGDADPWVSKESSEAAIQALLALSAETRILVRPGGHTIAQEEILGAQEFLLHEPPRHYKGQASLMA